MSKIGLGLTLTALSLKASLFSEHADQNDIPCMPTAPPCGCEHEWASNLEIGGNYTRVYLHPHGSSSFSGNLGGVQGMYEYRPKKKFYGAAKLAWRQGDTHGSSGKRHLLFIDTQERLGFTFGCEGKETKLTLFSGLGFRYVGQKLRPKTGSSIKFNYNEFYVPVGFILDGALNSWFALGTEFTWMPQIFPTVTIPPLKGTHWSLTNRLNNYFVDLSFDFTLTKNKRFHLIFRPFYEHWQDGHSTAKTTSGISLGLPGNTYNFWGIDVNFSYRF